MSISNIQMDKYIDNLKLSMKECSISLILSDLDKIIKIIPSLSSDEIEKYKLDHIIKDILNKYKNIEIIGKIENLIPLIRDPKSFYNEIVIFLKYPDMRIPALMLIYELSLKFDFIYDDFYYFLRSELNVVTAESEGFLIFLIRSLSSKNISREDLTKFIEKLSDLSLKVSSEVSIRLIYSILVIMRIHPDLFPLSYKLKELSTLKYSFNSIKGIINRIYEEAKDPSIRPKKVFLLNFSFPPFE